MPSASSIDTKDCQRLITFATQGGTNGNIPHSPSIEDKLQLKLNRPFLDVDGDIRLDQIGKTAISEA
jgi:hypothetical protein